MQCLWPAQPNALLAWLRDHEPRTMKRAGWVLMCKDYIRFRLTGKIQAELTDMSGTSLMNVGTAQYDDRVLEAFGIGEMRSLLPPLVRSAEVCGRVTPEAAAQTGLTVGTPVAGGMFDIDACALASGMVDETSLAMVAGTWANHLTISTTPVVSADIFMTSCYAMQGWYLMLEGSATSASNLEWFVTEFFQAEQQAARKKGRGVYDLVNDLVAATTPEDPQVVFLPFLYGSNVGPDAKGAFVGLTGWHKRGHVLRAIYEGVVFSHLRHLRRLLKFRPVPRRIRLTGGAARSRVWVQIFADAFQVPVEIPAGGELGALGAAICAGVAGGCFKDFPAAVKAMVRYARMQKPDPAKKELYEAKFRRCDEVISALAAVWKGLG
jgi:L-xylulokinase